MNRFIKVGLSLDTYMRSLALGSQRFDFKRSYVVRSRDQPSISLLERNLKTFISRHRLAPYQRLSSGNTETFQSSILPKMLGVIETFGKTFPDAQFHVDRYVSSKIPIHCVAPKLTREERKAKRLEKTTRLLTENIEENERKFAALKELLPKISVHSIEILQDNKAEFECKIHLHPGQIDLGAQLFNAGRMIIAFETDTHHGGCAWGVSVLTTTRVNDTCTLHLYFDLEAEEKFSRSFIRQDIHIRFFVLWRNFVANMSQMR